MIAVDTSALIAVFLNEKDAEWYSDVLGSERRVCVSVATLLECTLVLQGKLGDEGEGLLSSYLEAQRPEQVPVDHEQLAVARLAARRFGRGRHRAGLNFGDCFSYALARARNIPLLFKGDDFSMTDVEVVSAPGGVAP
ncbi:MAG: type II toxin-antitoxin system VapC family toxin [Myxococcota bacterium]